MKNEDNYWNEYKEAVIGYAMKHLAAILNSNGIDTFGANEEETARNLMDASLDDRKEKLTQLKLGQLMHQQFISREAHQLIDEVRDWMSKNPAIRSPVTSFLMALSSVARIKIKDFTEQRTPFADTDKFISDFVKMWVADRREWYERVKEDIDLNTEYAESEASKCFEAFKRSPKMFSDESERAGSAAYNVGSSDYAKHKIQPWDIWEEYKLNPWDADIVKRVLRDKATQSRREDYEKIIHICKKRLEQIAGGYSHERKEGK